MLLSASIVFIYYTVWAILLVRLPFVASHLMSIDLLQPFFDATSPIHGYFPAREWAIRLPAFVLTVGLAVIGTFIGSTIIKENRKKTQKARLRTA